MNAQIKKIEELIPLPPGKKIAAYQVKRLTAPGENYGSLILSLDITVTTPSGIEELNVIAKMVPPNEFLQQVFNTPVSFRNEIAFYKNVVPTLENFQKTSGTKIYEFGAKYYGGRLNLTGGDKVDADAVLLLENLKIANYITLERTEGLDLEAAKLVIMNLAHFHAIPLALKLKKPEVFEKEVKPYLAPFLVREDHHNNKKKNLSASLDKIKGLRMLKERILEGFDRQLVEYEVREPWATIVHNDCWSNNNMFKIEGGTVVKSIMVDFQACSYDSPARDVIFFLFTSLKDHVLEDHYDNLLRLYHGTFLNVLKELHCDTTPFSAEAFQEEIDFEAKYSQFGHIAFMLFPIYAPPGTVKDISEITPQTLANKEVTNLLKQKFIFFVNEFINKNWV